MLEALLFEPTFLGRVFFIIELVVCFWKCRICTVCHNRVLLNFCCSCFRVLLRVRMLYYIKHEIIGDLVQHMADGVHIR